MLYVNFAGVKMRLFLDCMHNTVLLSLHDGSGINVIVKYHVFLIPSRHFVLCGPLTVYEIALLAFVF